MTDYTNDRWHVHGAWVTHDDLPYLTYHFDTRGDAEHRAVFGSAPGTHFARAWLAAQPKPTIKAGMRIEATLRGGAVVSGVVDSVSQLTTCSGIIIGGVRLFLETGPESVYQLDILTWHEVTS